jgi:hypothetical protein
MPRPACIHRHFEGTTLNETQHAISAVLSLAGGKRWEHFMRSSFSHFVNMEAVDYWIPDVS